MRIYGHEAQPGSIIIPATPSSSGPHLDSVIVVSKIDLDLTQGGCVTEGDVVEGRNQLWL